MHVHAPPWVGASLLLGTFAATLHADGGTVTTYLSQTPDNNLLTITARPADVMVRGQGSYLWNSEGVRYLDMIQGWAVNCLGHAPRVLNDALAAQAQLLWNPSPAFHNDPQMRLARALFESSGLSRAFFCNSGAEANESAIKLARKWGAGAGQGAAGIRHEIITTIGSFHGRTLTTMAASGKPAFRGLFAPTMPGFRHVPFGDSKAVETAITPQTVAVMLEPIQGEAGVIVPPTEYLAQLRQLCNEHGLLLIADEVQTGIGRTGRMFACDKSNTSPDIMTLGKGLGGGAPLAAMLCTEQLNCFSTGDQGGTFNGNPLMTAIGAAVLAEVNTPDFLTRVNELSQCLRKGLQQLCDKHGHVEVRGEGLLLALELRGASAGAMARSARANGLILNACQPTTLRLMPALNVSESEIQQALGILDQSLRS